MQLLADAFDSPTIRLEADEGPAFGAAILAGVGEGIWPSVEEACVAIVRTAEEFEPNPARRDELRDARAIHGKTSS